MSEDDTPHSDDFFVSSNKQELDLTWTTNTLLETYWAKHRTHEIIAEAIKNSLCFGLFQHKLGAMRKQVGFARVITDYATSSELCDVIISPAFRKMGLGRFLVSTIVNDPRLRETVMRLGTRDAQEFYRKFGFTTHERMFKAPAP